MRRTYISPEFVNSPVPGTLNMKEQKFPFGSKMMEIEDKISISQGTVFWYENSQNEQIDLIAEKVSNPKTTNFDTIKKLNSRIDFEKNQSQDQKETNCRWNIQINWYEVLSSYIFSRIKQARTFEGITQRDTLKKNVDLSIREYIDKNIISRYEFLGIDFWIKYERISQSSRLKWQNNFNPLIRSDFYKSGRYSQKINEKDLSLLFNQEFTAGDFSFDWYFDLNFGKI